MTSHHSEQRRDRAWQALRAVQDHPQIKAWLEAADQQRGGKQDFEEHATKRMKRWLGVAAAGIAIVAVGILGYWHFTEQRYETHVGEQRDVLLADGSRITLNTDTAGTLRSKSCSMRLNNKPSPKLSLIWSSGR